MNRMISLVSLYLESESQGDIDRAIELIWQKSILELSREWSELIKELWKFRYDDLLPPSEDQRWIYDVFKLPEPWSQWGNLRKYQFTLINRKEKFRENSFIQAIKKLYQNKLPENFESSGVEEWVFPYIITGRPPYAWDFECIADIQNGKINKTAWIDFLNQFSWDFPDLAQKYSYEYCIKEYMWSKETLLPHSFKDEEFGLWENAWQFWIERSTKRKFTLVLSMMYQDIFDPNFGFDTILPKRQLLIILKAMHESRMRSDSLIQWSKKNTSEDDQVSEMIQQELRVAWDDMIDNPKPPSRISAKLANLFQLSKN